MLKAITLWPEWAWAVCYLFKRVENRGWAPPRSLLGLPLLIHAGANVGGAARSMSWIDTAMRRVCETAQENGWSFSRRGVGDYVLEALSPQWSERHGIYSCPREIEFVHDRIPYGQFVALTKIERVTSPVDPAVAGEFVVRQGVPKWGTYGAHHWHLADIDFVVESPTYPGRQRVWNVPDEVRAQLKFATLPQEWLDHWEKGTGSRLT